MTINGKQDEGVDISATGGVADAQPTGKAAVTTVVSNADGDAQYKLQVSNDGENWEDYHDFGTVSSIQDTREVASRHARLAVTTTGTGSSADVFFFAGD